MISQKDGPFRGSAGLYVRLSREEEGEGPSQSVTNQLSLLQDFVDRHGLTVYDSYIDDGWSGTDFDRPAFRRLLDDIEQGRVDLVLTKDLSRLGRDYILTGHYLERYFPEHGVRYISLLDGIDTGVESGANDATPFRAIINDLYARDISRKIKSVKQDKQRKGLFIGGRPVYGYRMHPTQKNRIVVDEAAAATVRRVFELARGGSSCRAIAALLNKEGTPTPAVYAGLPEKACGSGLWSAQRIADMLQNETYLGHMVQGRSVKVSYKSKKCRRKPKEEWVVVADTHEPLIDADTFQQARLQLASRRRTRSRKYDYLLKGLVFCHECGCPLTVLNRKNAAGEDRLYFVCRTYQRLGKEACACHCCRERMLTEAVIERLRQLCDPFLGETCLLPVARQALAQAGPGEKRAERLRAVITAGNARLDRVYLDHLNGLLTAEDLGRLFSRIREEQAAAQAALNALQAAGRSGEAPGVREKELARAFREQAFGRRELLVRLIERVELTSDKRIVIRLRVRDPAAVF